MINDVRQEQKKKKSHRISTNQNQSRFDSTLTLLKSLCCEQNFGKKIKLKKTIKVRLITFDLLSTLLCYFVYSSELISFLCFYMVLFLLKNKRSFSLFSIKIEHSCSLLLTNIHNTKQDHLKEGTGRKIF